MTRRLLPARVLVLAGSWSLVACATTDLAPPPEPATVLRVDAPVPRQGERQPVGWIYTSGNGRREKSCVYIWSDGTWTLASESSPGFYGDVLSAGYVGMRGADGFAPLIGFPRETAARLDRVRVGGEVQALFRGELVKDAEGVEVQSDGP